MSTELLDLHVKLLVLEHGKERVLSCLARIANISESELHQQLASIKPKDPKPKSRPSTDAILARLDVSPLRRDLIASIAREFEQKRFLGELRLVGKFFREHGVKHTPKSRMDALSKVLSILATLPETELQSLVKELANGSSDLGFADLAGAIMRPTGKG